MSAHDALQTGLGKAFDALSDQFLPDAVITLIKPSQTYGQEYDDVLTITSKRFFEYSNFRQNFLLEIADTSDELTEAMRQATHVRVGEEVYAINPADPTPPQGTDVTWKIYCERDLGNKGRFNKTL